MKNFIKKILNFFFKKSPWDFNPLMQYKGPTKVDRYIKFFPELECNFSLDPSQHLDYTYSIGRYDKKSIDFLLRELDSCKYFLDIGANMAFYSFVIAKNKTGIQSIAIDPDPYNHTKFRRNLEINSELRQRVHFKNIAVGTKKEKLDLMLNTSGNRAGSSLCIDQREFTQKKNNETIEVEARSLSNILQDFGIGENVGWCAKFDIEGYEYPVINEFFSNSSDSVYPKALVIEWTGRGIKSESGENSINLLERFGYKLVGKESCNYFFKKE